MSRDPNELVEPVRQRLETLRADAAREGIDFIITYTMRTDAEQHALFAQGRKGLNEVNRLRTYAGLAPIKQSENRVVTKLFKSVHQFGCAFDIAIVKDGKPDWADTASYEKLGELGESIGLRWGGRFKFRDLCHFEYTGGLAIAQLEKGERPTA
ncbi:MAG: M15 family metallopeptidase [Actinomycetota bacterium]|nr:M15 family metallopeptidase [Actinomycetota bacterium]